MTDHLQSEKKQRNLNAFWSIVSAICENQFWEKHRIVYANLDSFWSTVSTICENQFWEKHKIVYADDFLYLPDIAMCVLFLKLKIHFECKI